MILEEMCPMHSLQLVSVEQKPALLGKCPLKLCFYGIHVDDPTRAVVDITEWNQTHDGQEAESL